MIQPVPIPGRPQPLQLPQHYDPAGIIMQAAALRQQKELTQQKMQQDMLENIVGSIQTAASLAEKKREFDASNAMAQQTLQMHQQKLSPEVALMQAHANYFNQMAGGGDDAISGMVGMLKSGLATPQDIYSMSSRWPQGAKLKLASALSSSGVDLKGAGLDLLTQKKEIETQQGPTFQQRIRGGQSILPNFQNVIDMADKLGLSSFAPANKIKLAALRQINDPRVAAYDTTRNAVSEEMARYFGGGVSSDMKIRMGQAILGNDGANSKAINAALLGPGGAYDVIQNQVQAYQGIKNIAPTNIPPSPAKIRVKKLTTGETGSLNQNDFNPDLYERLP